MKKFSKLLLALLVLTVSLCPNIYADVTLRFWDNGVLAHTAPAEGTGTVTLTGYYNESDMRAEGYLSACDGYTFAGWKVASPILNETVCANDEASGISATVTIGTTDIDLYAVYKRTVTCYQRIFNLTDLVNGGKYLIVGKNASDSYAMNYTDLGNPGQKYKGLSATQVSTCRLDSTIFEAAAACVWNLSGNRNGSYSFRNNSSDDYLYIMYDTGDRVYYFLTQTTQPTNLTFAVNNGVWTMEYAERNNKKHKLYFAISNNFNVLNTHTNIFTAGYNNDDVPSSRGNIYLYKQTTESRYKSKCGPYTLQFRACGDNSCGSDFTVSPNSLTETQTATTCVGLSQFSGVNPNSVSPTIGCTSVWSFSGWAVEPCVDQTTSDPSATYITANPYALYHQNDVLYAVYRHKTDGVDDYWSSYPACTPNTVTFYPCNGQVGGSSAPYPLTEDYLGAGVTLPEASFGICSGWTFAGWAEAAVVSANSAPSGLLISGIYYPSSNGEKFYAVYTKSGRWTSYPVCEAASVTLNAVTGTVEGNTTKVLTEENEGEGVALLAATTSCSSIWMFAGWSNSVIATTTTEPSLYASGATYHPINASDILYAVYYRGALPNRVWTSSPSCSAYHVVLHACGADACDAASVNGKPIDTIPEGAIGSGVELPSAVTSCTGRWAFVGWHKGSPISYKYTAPDDLYSAGDSYVPTQDYEKFYAVYGHVTGSVGVYDCWTSNPDCERYTVWLHTCEGTFAGGATDVDSTEVVAGNGVVLPTPTPLCAARGWTFHGWVEGGDLTTTQNIAGLTILSAGTRYKPIRNNIHLYAVYSVSAFKQVTSYDELNNTDEYVIAFYGDYGHSYQLEYFALSNRLLQSDNTYYLGLSPIEAYTDEEGNKYVSAPVDSCRWRLDGNRTNGWTFRNMNDNSYVYSWQDYEDLAVNNTATSFNINIEESCIERKTYSANYRYWHFTQVNNFELFISYQSSSPDRCYLFHSTGTVYSSWPHCAEYTVFFDGCDGRAASLSETEENAGKGVPVPNVSQVCDGWTFAGWATAPYEDKTGILTRNLYPAGSTYVPEKNNSTLYAVYCQTKDTFEIISGLNEMYSGVNYLIVYNGSRAMGNTLYNQAQGWGINASQVNPAGGQILNPANATKWQLQGRDGHYIWYNPAGNKYLDLSYLYDSYYYASLQSTATDNFNISYANNSYFLIRSNTNQTTLRYDADGGYYDCYAYTSSSDTKIKLYRQKADYWSYPCSTPIEPVRWGDGSVTVESLTLSNAPTSGSASISSIVAGEDGTFVISHSAKPGNQLRILWGGNYYRMVVPYIVSPSYTPTVENLPDFDLVVLPNAQFTVGLETHLHTLSVYDNASLIIADGCTLHVDTLYLRSEGTNNHPNITFGGPTAAIVVNSGVVYHDRRIDWYDYYPLGVPYDVELSETRYAGLVANTATPVQNTNYWIQYYNGAARAADANAGNSIAGTYWTRFSGATLSGGTGYAIGIADNTVGNHNKRTMRFRMTPMSGWNEYEDGTNNRAISITPSKVNASDKKHHSGWNFVCNPYLHTYYPGNADASSGLLTGHFELGDGGKWEIAQDGTQAIPYITFYDASARDYYQATCNNSTIRPFTAVFVQVEDNDMLLFQNPIAAQNHAPALRRNTASESRVVRTGIVLQDNQQLGQNGESFCYDETGLVISNRYTAQYEVGADLVKMSNPSFLHVYTRNETHNLAFNALDEQTASQPISVGVSIPQTGSYTFFFDERQYDRDALEALWLTDFEMHETVNLLENDYTCTINAGVNESRFALNAVVRPYDVPTDVESVVTNGIYMLTNDDGSTTFYGNSELVDVSVYDLAGRLVGMWTPNSYQWTANLPQGVYAVSIRCADNKTIRVKMFAR